MKTRRQKTATEEIKCHWRAAGSDGREKQRPPVVRLSSAKEFEHAGTKRRDVCQIGRVLVSGRMVTGVLLPPPRIFRKNVKTGGFKSNVLQEFHLMGVAGRFSVRISSKGLSGVL